MKDLSVLIPARNELFLRRTIEDALTHIEADTEIIAICDGGWAPEPIPDHPRLTLVYHAQARGQRAAVNEAARLSKAKYIMKLDAHCSVAPGFDAQLIADADHDTTQIPRMYNLHAFDWVCQSCQSRIYQGGKPDRCGCGGEFQMDVVWKPRMHRKTDFARFDSALHFQYWRDYDRRPQAQADIADVMCFVGAAFFMERSRFWELGGLDERHGSWGQMGVEVSCKSWLSGGRMVVNKRSWFAHLFRTQPGFGFPYDIKWSEQEAAREYSRALWTNNQWEGQVYPLSWLVERFAPVPDWGN